MSTTITLKSVVYMYVRVLLYPFFYFLLDLFFQSLMTFVLPFENFICFLPITTVDVVEESVFGLNNISLESLDFLHFVVGLTLD